MIDKALLTGRNNQNIDYHSAEAPMHKEVVDAFKCLQAMAAEQGFDLAVASSYRDYDRQLAIWNAKLTGARPVFDQHNRLLSLAPLSPWQQIEAVLRWSALPGASRHHWGTDIDVYDRSAVAADYKVQLSLEEVGDTGPFCSLHDWLDSVLVAVPELGFFRPYNMDRGGVAPERWHLSYAPIAAKYQQALSEDILRQCCEQADLQLKEVVLDHLSEIMRRFVSVPINCYPAHCRSMFK